MTKITCKPAGTRTVWHAAGHAEWKLIDTAGPGLEGLPFGPVMCYWKLVAPGTEWTIHYEICSDTCKKVDWLRETKKDPKYREEVLMQKQTRAWRGIPIPGQPSGLMYLCDSP
jgi:hypothetical protein